MSRLFILGAPDPEMREIRRVLLDAGESVVYAMAGDARVSAGTAYQGDAVSSRTLPAGATLVFVECQVWGLPRDQVVDHHREGDPGHACAPSDFLAGSSLGQVLALLGQKATAYQRMVCAADHCLSSAYQGFCPGVCPEALQRWRLASKAIRYHSSSAELSVRVQREFKKLQQAEKIEVAGKPVAWVPFCVSETREAAAIHGIPMVYAKKTRAGTTKMGILNADPSTIQTWIDDCGLQGVYGSPVRGYAGGYSVEARA